MKIEYIKASELREGDFVLAPSLVDSRIVRGETVSQRYEYDEFTYINYGTTGWPNDEIISVIRQES
ncbi:hypothetical protein SEA_JOURNEY13_76 [Mycobacterium phage Journey13]|nr:hypothetical protein SEA_JOURNEY13_76 [Mycobacterium phage Journey13]